MLLTFLSDLITNEAGRAVVLPLTIILCTMFLEDFTIIVVALLAADDFIPVSTAFFFLWLGSMLGDLMFYAIGSLMRTHPGLARYLEHDLIVPVRDWLSSRYRITIFSGHFIPGLRSTSYVASGFFRYPLRQYLPAALSGGFILLTSLFTVAYWFGNLTRFIGPARWLIAIGFLIALVLIGRHNLMTYRERKAEETIG